MTAVATRRASKTVAPPSPTIGSLADALYGVIEEKKVKEAELKEIEGRKNEIEKQLMELMDEQKTDKGAGALMSVSITSSIVANVEDWDALWKFILRTKNTQLLQRRVSEPAFREMLEMKGSVPGITPFSKRKLNHNSRS